MFPFFRHIHCILYKEGHQRAVHKPREARRVWKSISEGFQLWDRMWRAALDQIIVRREFRRHAMNLGSKKRILDGNQKGWSFCDEMNFRNIGKMWQRFQAESDQLMMVSLKTSNTTMLLLVSTMMLVLVLVESCERRGEQLICQEELTNLDANQVRWEFKRDDKIFAFWDDDGITVDHRPLSVSVRVL